MYKKILSIAFLLSLAACGGSEPTTQPAPVIPGVDVPATTSLVTDKPVVTQPPVVQKTVNSVDTIINDMKLVNDTPLNGYSQTTGWYVGPGQVMMGVNTDPVTGVPDWAKDTWEDGVVLTKIIPWTVIFDGVGSTGQNFNVAMRNFKIYYFSKTQKKWILLDAQPGPQGGEYYDKNGIFNVLGTAVRKVLADGSSEITPPRDLRSVWHGWADMKAIPDKTDVAAWWVTLQAKLVLVDPNAPDERKNVKYLVQVGADYYPNTGKGYKTYNPGVAVSRAKLLTTEWQAFNMLTLKNVGVLHVGNGAILTEAELRANPPPLE